MSLSHSAIDAYKKCPRRYEYAFVKKMSQQMTKEAAFGVGMHSALSKWGKRETKEKIEKREEKREQQALFTEETPTDFSHLTSDFLISLWHESFVTNGYDTTFEADYDRKRGKKLMKVFYEWWGGEEREVVAVEMGFKMAMNGVAGLRDQELGLRKEDVNNPKSNVQSPESSLTGRFDRIEKLSDGSLRIIDFKTGKTRSQEAVDQDLQMSVYAMAAEKEFEAPVSEIILLFLNEDGLTERRTHRTAGELQTASKTISLIRERINQKDFAPVPSVDACTHCPFRRVCSVSMSNS